MMRVSFGDLSMSLFPVLVAISSFLNAQESTRPRGEPTPPIPRSFSPPPDYLESMRERLNPYQPQKLQSLLMNPVVQAQLEIDHGTYGLVAKALAEVMKKSAEVFKDFDPTDTSNREAMQARMEKYKELQAEREHTTAEALNEIFPPEKYNRLKQIALRIQIQEAGLGNVLLRGVLADELAFSDAQRETMTSKAAEYEQEKQAEIRQIVEDYDAKLLAHLTAKQRKFYDQQVGEPFEYAPVSREAQNFERYQQYQDRMAPRRSE